MKNTGFYNTILIVILINGLASAQQDFELTLYNYHTGVYNPASVGTQNGTFLKTSFRSQWFGIKDAPRIQAITIGFPSGEKRSGYGLLVTNDDSFIERQTRMYGTFSYRLPLNNSWNLHLGLSAGGNNFSVNFDELNNLQQISDSSFETYSHFNPNIGVGAYLEKENFYFSLSVPQLLASKRYKDQQGLSTTARDRPHIYAISGLRIPIQDDWTWVNSALFRYVSDAPVTAVINSGVGYRKMEATLGYHVNAGITGTFMLQELEDKSFSMGYSYQMPTAGHLRSLTKGNHEILLSIRLGKTKQEKLLDEDLIHEKKIGMKKLTP